MCGTLTGAARMRVHALKDQERCLVLPFDEVPHQEEIAFRLSRGNALAIWKRLELVDTVISIRKDNSRDWTTGLSQGGQAADGLSRGRIAILAPQYPKLRNLEVVQHWHGVVLCRHAFEQAWTLLARSLG